MTIDIKTKDEIKKRIAYLYTWKKAELIAEVERNYRVIDTKGMSKDNAVSYILEAEYGRKQMIEFYERSTK